MKQELCVKSINEGNKFKEIYNQTRRNHPEAAVHLPFAKCENLMFKWRRTTWPRRPNSLREYAQLLNSQEYDSWRQYNGGEFTVSHITDIAGSNSVIFIDPLFAKKINEGNSLNIDGTFKIVPQIDDGNMFVTFMMSRFNHGFPLAYALMENKTETAYRSVFHEIQRIVPEFSATTIMTDYEPALQNSARAFFPNGEHHACYYHYTQSIYRNAVQLDLKVYLTNDREGNQFLRQILALGLLPHHVVQQTYRAIKRSKSQRCLRIMRAFLMYFERHWLRNITPRVFSVFGLAKRTNNTIESYHKVLKSHFGIHSAIWAFTKSLLSFQEGFILDLKTLERGNQLTRTPKAITIMRDQFITYGWTELQAGRKTPLEFLNEYVAFNRQPLERYLDIFGM
ncbi:uncharacterized protein LOC127285708 [Leptopilina boulardi]|uniref:uncharacterized protein LOC127285708 n=1 Tax=Leptopilina boulardi TaxID=63433 RepID=UPI0021F5F674|nr:uncharacterized protein LOC127276996 isoform X1 [Leptopilina boulardi]XP_051167803.1 uncharacterized protein LOC127285708 [Leptopilina boulardi]